MRRSASLRESINENRRGVLFVMTQQREGNGALMYNIGKGTPLAWPLRLVGIGFAVVALFYWLIR
jgi:hypothetical protein